MLVLAGVTKKHQKFIFQHHSPPKSSTENLWNLANICGVWLKHHRFFKIRGVWVKHHNFFPNMIWAVFSHCLCAFVSSSLFFCLSFCLSPIFCSDCSKLCSVAASVRKIGNYYDDFDCNTSLWPCGICIWANTRHKYANTQIQKRSPRHLDTGVHFSPKTNRKMSWG